MLFRIAIVGVAAALLLSQQASAQSDMVDLRHIESVAAAIQRAGYKAEIKTNTTTGKRYISSAANGDEFSVDFFGCDDPKGCTSLSFSSWWKKQPYFTTDMVNEWNAGKRFLKVAIDKDGDLDEYMDVSALGGVSYEFFADTLDWYVTMDADFSKFMNSKKPAK